MFYVNGEEIFQIFQKARTLVQIIRHHTYDSGPRPSHQMLDSNQQFLFKTKHK